MVMVWRGSAPGGFKLALLSMMVCGNVENSCYHRTYVFLNKSQKDIAISQKHNWDLLGWGGVGCWCGV